MHDPNWTNQTVWTGDCLDIMRGMNSECVDLIYLDPPFNSNANYAAPVGSEAAGAEFKDTWGLDDLKVAWHALIQQEHPDLYQYLKAVLDMHSKSMMAYLIYMAVRIMEMKRLLKPTGSIYLHCDPYASHYLKLLLDVIFGRKQFRNEVVWAYRGMYPKQKKWQSKHDYILFYSKSDEYIFNVLRTDPTPESLKTYESAQTVGYLANHKRKMVVVYDREKYEKAVKTEKIPKGMREVSVEENKGRPPFTDWWADIKILGGPKNKERVGYPTQKPLALLKRIVQASTIGGGV